MKLALCTTTINVPRVLGAYREAMPNTHFFITGDRKTPDTDAVDFLDGVSAHSYYGYDFQAKLGYECHDLIGENTIQRRNIAFLEALKHGADIIFSIDDDNLTTDERLEEGFLAGFNRKTVLDVMSKSRWFDPGQHLVPPSVHRGFPYNVDSLPVFGMVPRPKIGVVAGLCLGDPDISAYTRMANKPNVTAAVEIMHSGVAVNPYSWTVFNSQFTAIRREFVPAWFMWTGVGRMDDIYASLVVQRVMRDRGYHVYFGKPFALQQRNDHNLVKDLRAEIDGYENVTRLATILDNVQLLNKSVIEDCRRIWGAFEPVEFVPDKTIETAHAWLNDCERCYGFC